MSESLSFKNINKLAIPSILAGIIEPIISISDTAIIGHVQLNPTESIASIGIVGSFMSALFWILAQTKNAISTIVSQKLGEKQLDKIKKLVPQVLFMNLLLGITLVLFTRFFAIEIFELYAAKNTILNYSVSYYNIRVYGLVFTLITFSIFGILRGLQNTYWAMLISITGGVINIILDYIFVYGIEGFINPMHIEGAAWASLIAQFTMMILAIIIYLSKTPFNFKVFGKIHPQISHFLRLTGNLIIRTIALNVAIFLSNRYATNYGKNYIAVHVIFTQIWLFTTFFLDGYADAGNSISGKLLGAKDFKNLQILSRKILKYSLYISGLLSLVFLLGYQYIGLIFSNKNEVLKLFYQNFWLIILIQPAGAVAFIYDGIFKGLGWVSFLKNMQLFATFIVFIPVLLLLDYLSFKLPSIWIAFLLWMLFRAGSLHWKFTSSVEKRSLSRKTIN